MTFKIAILLPIYNGVEYFEESFASIILQNYQHWQLWIGINGYEPEESIYNKIKKIIEPYAKSHEIMLFDFGKRANKAATLNLMVKLLPEEIKYIALIDVDDVWFPNKLEMQIKHIPQFDVIGSKCKYFGKNIPDNIIPNIPVGDFTRFPFTMCNPIINSSVIIKKEFAHWDEESKIEDYELWLNLQKKGSILFYNCADVLIKHRIHSSSAFNNVNTQYVSDVLSRYK